MRNQNQYPSSARSLPLRVLLTTLLAVSLLLTSSSALYGQSLNGKVAGSSKSDTNIYKVGKKIILTASFGVEKAQYLWIPLGENGASLDTEQQGSKLYVWAPKGTYSILVIASVIKDGGLQQGQVTHKFSVVDGDDPAPVDPVPVPTPVDDALVKLVKDAFLQETNGLNAQEKAKVVEDVKLLSEVFKSGATLTASQKVKTVSQLNGVVHDTAVGVLDERLPKIRKDTLAKYMNANLPADPNTALTDELRGKFKALYLKIAAALDKVAQ